MNYLSDVILLVEDSNSDAELTIRSLKKDRMANEIVWVKDGDEALDFLYSRGLFADRKTGIPRLILLDLKLPKVSGLEVLQLIKSDPKLKSIPVTVLSSSELDPDIRRCYELGVNSYIVKPLNFEDFSKCIVRLGMYWTLTNLPPI
jgi:two-component system response regulator